ncbi:hypothetical protein [Flavobacterium sp. MK4S-17]|uniref:hypothetical protein n=1 Tax=Flavobacterium sp. MK4S-17 TaxID=2543737 RepID=UPI001357F5F8|nr:hypothetical protein [Flavobacterium sp. MK4S-17]
MNQQNPGNGNYRNAGRKMGSSNKFTKEAQENLQAILVENFEKLERLMNALPPDERIVHLKNFAKILVKGNDETSTGVKEVIFEQLLPHYKKMGQYLSHVDPDRKIREARQYLQLLNPQQIQEIIVDMNKRQNIKMY